MDYSKLKVVDLKKILTERGLTAKGLKADLVKRLQEDDLAKQNSNVENEESNTENSNNETSEAKVETNNVSPVKESITEEAQPVQEPVIQQNNETTTTENDNSVKQKGEEEVPIKSPKKEVMAEEKKIETSEDTKSKDEIKDQLIEKETEKHIETENKDKKENDNNLKNKSEKTSTKEKSNEPEVNTKEIKEDKVFQEQKKETKNETKPNIPKTEQPKENESQPTKKEAAPQIHIAGTSHNEVADVNPKKRTLNTEDNNEEVSKRKKTEDSNNTSPVEKTSQDTILINNFVRPLITRSVKELVSQYGEVKSFWMDSIKSHAYVTYTSVESAEKACKGINGIKFPEETGKILSVEYISEEESKERIKKEEEKRLSVNISGIGSKSIGSTPIRGRFDSLYASRIGIPIKTGKLSQDGSKKSDTSPFSTSPTTISPSSIARAAASQSIKIIGKNKENTESISISSSPIKETYASLEVDRAVQSRVSSRYKRSRETPTTEVSFLHNKSRKGDDSKSTSDKKSPAEEDKKTKKPTMDDLFKKTKAIPTIYYKPLTEEEVKQKEKREIEERIRSRERLRERLRERERENKRSRKY